MHAAISCSFSFRISNPRKGTETEGIKPYESNLMVSEYLIPARGLKLSQVWTEIRHRKVSEYLIPARGLKPIHIFIFIAPSRCFRISNPRKGTETSHIRLDCDILKSFRISNPRKGTETSTQRRKQPRQNKVSEYLIPARGLKHYL